MDETGPENSEHQATQEHLRLADINHEEYDALADLFLGDGSYAPQPVSIQEAIQGSLGEDAADHQEVSEPTHETHTPVLQLAGHDEPEEFESSSAGMRVLETLDETNANASALLAELLAQHVDDEMLGQLAKEDGLGSENAIRTVMMPNPLLEVVVLGHLPVRATLWARQYACSQAKENDEVVALIRAASGSTAIDLITADHEISVRSFTSLDTALASVSTLADRVILRVDGASEPELLDRPEVEAVTILTGADEAAVVASYRLIKTLDATLVEHRDDQDSQGVDDAPMLRLAVMGAGQEQAHDACEKLRNAVDTFIQRPIEILVGSARIDATGTKNIYRDTIAHPVSHIIDSLVLAAQRESDPVSLHLADDSIDQDTSLIKSERSVEFPSSGVPMPEPKMVRQPKVALKSEPDSASEPAPESAPEPIYEPTMDKAQSAKAESKGSKSDAPTLRDGLCSLIDGLDALEAKCPKASGVELAMDSAGRLHLVACDAETDDAMNQLLAAQTWARNNLGLLLRAEPGLEIPSPNRDTDTDAMMHLISEDPRTIREIFDTPVRIYALARVKVGKIIAQVATPIN